MDKETALRMARKLAQINGQNATEAEALLAAEHLARIAREHGLSRMDWTPEQIKSGVKQDTGNAMNTDRRAKPPSYVYQLTSRVCNVFTVRVIWIGDTHFCDFLGDETNVTLVKFFLEELLAVVPKLRWKAKCEAKVEGPAPAWKQSWERGFIDAIADRLTKIMENMSEAQATACRALVLVTRELIEAEIKAKYGNLGYIKDRKQHHLDRSAYERGQQDGKKQRLQANI
jgi:hypothetical protein